MFMLGCQGPIPDCPVSDQIPIPDCQSGIGIWSGMGQSGIGPRQPNINM